MALGKQFNSLTKDIKKALEENCNEINLHCTYLHEYSAYVAQLYFGTKKPFSDPQILYGQFPQKGAKKVKGKNYALFGLQAFLTEFGSLDAMGIVQQAKKLVGQPSAGMKQKQDVEKEQERAKKQKVCNSAKEDGLVEKTFSKLVEGEIRNICLLGIQEVVAEEMSKCAANPTEPVSTEDKATDLEHFDEMPGSQVTSPIDIHSIFTSPLGHGPENPNIQDLQPRLLFPGTSSPNPAFPLSPYPRSFPTHEFGGINPAVSGSLNNSHFFYQQPVVNNPSQQFPSTNPTYFSQQPSASFAAMSSQCGLTPFFSPSADLIPSMSGYSTVQQQHSFSSLQQQGAVQPMLQLSSQKPPAEVFHEYMKKHSWRKVWGERNPDKVKKLPAGEKGKGPKKVNIPFTSLKTDQFKHRRNCAVYEQHFRKLGEVCPSMQLQDVTSQSGLLCEECQVHLHESCHTFFHMFLAKEGTHLSLTVPALVFDRTEHIYTKST